MDNKQLFTCFILLSIVTHFYTLSVYWPPLLAHQTTKTSQRVYTFLSKTAQFQEWYCFKKIKLIFKRTFLHLTPLWYRELFELDRAFYVYTNHESSQIIDEKNHYSKITLPTQMWTLYPQLCTLNIRNAALTLPLPILGWKAWGFLSKQAWNIYHVSS